MGLEGMAWQNLPFEALSAHQLYAILQLRSHVFVMEQNGVFQDMDNTDQHAIHLMGLRGKKLLAYARCFQAGVSFDEASIGRVITHGSVRRMGLGLVLMQKAITCVYQQWGAQPIRIGAQARFENFYRKLDFVTASAPYMEDGIPHIEMLRT
jgi:ElaA protein